MSPYWNPLLEQLEPYVPGEQPRLERLVKLNTNENPYGPSAAVHAAVAGANGDNLRLYPDPESIRLKQALARYHDLPESRVFVGNGSDEVLAHTFLALLKHERPILFPEISYSFYPVYCGLYQVDYRQLPLADDFSLCLEGYSVDNGGIIFPNPNAPTGLLEPLEGIRGLLERNLDSVVVVDEAYIDFGGESAIPLIDEFDNLLVTQTMSKSRSLAGLRIGMAFGHENLVEGLQRVKNSFNSYPLGSLSEAGAVAALEDETWFRETCARIIKSREKLTADLERLGFEVLPSSANFIFARPGNRPAAEVMAGLREQGVIVRHFKAPRVEEWLRISIGTDEECAALVAALDKVL